MEQITVTSTLEKIQELIDSNSGDTGRLNHIIDFINNEKPLYKTDKIYLEKKLNSKIVITPKKNIPKEDNTLSKIKKLMETGKGDPGRLEHISITIENEKILYESDRQYLKNNFGIVIIEKEKSKKQNMETGKTIIPEEKMKGLMPKNWDLKNESVELQKISKKIKKEEERENTHTRDSKEIGIQKIKLNELVIQRKNNEEKLIQERKLLEEKIKDERNIIQKQTETTEIVNLQKMELIQVQNERASILENIELQKNNIIKELAKQKRQLIEAQKEQSKIELQVNEEKTNLSKMVQEQKTRLVEQSKIALEIKNKQIELEKTKKDYEQIISQVNEEKEEIKKSENLKKEIKMMENELKKSITERLKILKTITKEKKNDQN